MSARRNIVWGIAVVLAIAAGIGFFAWRNRIPTNVAYVSEEEDGVAEIDLNTLEVVKRVHPPDVAPRGISVTLDGKYLVTADKDTADAAVFDTRRLKVMRRIQVGDNPEFVKLHPSGDWIFTSFEPGSTAGPPQEGSASEEEEGKEQEPPSQIVSFRTQDWSRDRNFVAGKETEGLEFSADGKRLIVANEAQDNIEVYDIASGKVVTDVPVGAIGKRPRGVKRSPRGNGYAVTMEGSGTLALLDNDFKVVRTVATAAKPYGVAFDRAGQRIFVAAAAAQKLEVFAADSLQLLAEAPIGKRCWHFTFTPDDSKILLACGRSNNVYIVDAKSYQTLRVLDGFHLPWGIVTYPHSFGSLDLP